MSETQTPETTPAAPAPAANISRPKFRIDRMPFNRTDLAKLTVEQRSAIYLNSIRLMLIFFVVLAAVGLVAGVILGILDINAVHNAQQTPTVGF